MEVAIGPAEAPLPDDRAVEVVERKGLGHPDAICDAVAEALSLELSRHYLARTGAIRHHNVDKVLLAAGSSQPRFGGGRVVEPARLFLAGRAALACDGISVPIAELAERAAQGWLERSLRAFDARRHLSVSCLVRPGSTELVGLFERGSPGGRALANDTSCGVGFAPLSEVERLVLAVEQGLNDEAARAADPARGEDVKVMAVRRGRSVALTIACAMIDGALGDEVDYAKAVERAAALARHIAARTTSLPVHVRVNAGDDPGAGQLYLTVTGTSAEAGDDGQAGRGNRANGLITPGRPMTLESVAGKNPVTHVGKLYNLAAGLAAERLAASLPGVRGAECVLVSRIGHPIDEPELACVRLAGIDAMRDGELVREAEWILRDELSLLPRLADELLSGALQLDRWPLRDGPRARALPDGPAGR